MPSPSAGHRLRVKPSSHRAAQELARLHISVEDIVFATYADSQGVSVYVKRGGHRPDIAGFLPNGHFDNWMSFFAVLNNGVDRPNAGYAGTAHAKKRFPTECV